MVVSKEARMQIQKLMVAPVFLLLFCSCVVDQVKINDTFKNDPDKEVALVPTKHKSPVYFKKGAQGLLDVAINEAIGSEMTRFLSTLDFSKEYEQELENILEENVKPKVSKLIVLDSSYESGFPEFDKPRRPGREKSSKKDEPIVHSDVDYRKLMDQGIEYAIIFEPVIYGLERAYYGFIPLGRPKGYAKIKIDIVEVKTNRLMWRETASSVVEIEGDWDTPPEYKNTLVAMKKSFRNSFDNLVGKMQAVFPQKEDTRLRAKAEI